MNKSQSNVKMANTIPIIGIHFFILQTIISFQ